VSTRKAARIRPAGRNGKLVCVAGASSISLCRVQLLIDQAHWLDLETGAELQHGHHARAEHLARRAAELRGQA